MIVLDTVTQARSHHRAIWTVKVATYPGLKPWRHVDPLNQSVRHRIFSGKVRACEMIQMRVEVFRLIRRDACALVVCVTAA